MIRHTAIAAASAAIAVAVISGVAGADSFTPVSMMITVAPVARLHTPLAISVAIAADADALDSSSPLFIRVKLAGECGGTFETTPGTVLLDRRLAPQPSTGLAFATTARGSGRPGAYGTQTVCTFLEEQGDNRAYATSQALQVDVSRPCTLAAARADTAARALTRARRRRGGVARARAVARRDHLRAAAVCGSGVPL